MKTIVFLGPSLRLSDAKQIYPDADYQPPVACGEILKTLEKQPKRIAIIDGYFHYTAAVWHKEILYALDKNVEIFGASSMGALRAAELYHFGMQGVGTIFNAYKEGVLQDDDEVAVLHATEKLEYIAKTDAMVNIRATLQDAYNSDLLSHEDTYFLLEKLKNSFYQKRNLIHEVSQFCEQKKRDKVKLLTWIKQNYHDQKKQDAIVLLNTLAQNKAQVARRSFSFSQTSFFKELYSNSI